MPQMAGRVIQYGLETTRQAECAKKQAFLQGGKKGGGTQVCGGGIRVDAFRP